MGDVFDRLRLVSKGDYVLSSDILDLKEALLRIVDALEKYYSEIGVVVPEIQEARRILEEIDVSSGVVVSADERNRITEAILLLYDYVRVNEIAVKDSAKLTMEIGGFPSYITAYYNYSDPKFEDALAYYNYSETTVSM